MLDRRSPLGARLARCGPVLLVAAAAMASTLASACSDDDECRHVRGSRCPAEEDKNEFLDAINPFD